jgi:hypothetical protein
MDDTLNLLLDGIIIVLLIPTIIYAVILNSRLAQLRDNRDDLARLVAAFNDATARAESGIPKLRQAAEDAGLALQERVEKAQTLRDDLAFMTERADTMAGRLETSVRQARDEVRPAAPPAETPQVAPARAPRATAGRTAPRPPSVNPSPVEPADAAMQHSMDDERSEAERELLRALQAVR